MITPVLAIDLPKFLETASVLMAFGAAAAVGLLRGTVGELRARLEDERGNAESQRQQIQDLKLDNATLNADLSALRRTVTGEVHWRAIEEKSDKHHEEAKAHWQEEKAARERQEEIFSGILAELRRTRG